jgi:RES domain-containing protein
MPQKMKVWRICKERHAKAAFSGEGTRIYAGRWNNVGTPMVYTATSISLAALEVFVHLDLDLSPDPLVLIEAELPFSAADCKRVDVAELPNDWRKEGNMELQDLGSKWAESKDSLAIMVPSAVINREWNVLVNPLHRDFKKVKLGQPEAFYFDERMFKIRR